MTAPTVEFESTGIGEWTEPETFEVTAERIAAYAEATNDPIERHRQGEIAPPVFAVVPVFMSMAPAALSVAPVSLLMKLVHGEQDIWFHEPIRPGDVLFARAKPTGFAGLPNGSTVTVYVETRTEAGVLVNEQWMTAFFRGVDVGHTVGDQAPEHKFSPSGDPMKTLRQHIDEDQTFRYSPASGDPMPIHLDEEIAQMSGLPGIINHGLCTMAFTSWGVLCELADSRVERLRRLSVRFARPVLPGQDIETSIWHAGSADGATSYAFETSVGSELVIRDGLAVITDS